MNPIRVDQCFNCGRTSANHIAMYCSEKLQQFVRCEDQKCWAACREASDHSAMCSMPRTPSRQLSDNDLLHRVSDRFAMTSTSGPITRYNIGRKCTENGLIGLAYTSAIAEDIVYLWENENNFVINGPSTMYFRVLIAVNKTIVARLDVGNELSRFTRIPNTSLEFYRDATKIQQTVAILVINENDPIQINTTNKVIDFCIQKADDGFMIWSLFEEK